MHHAPRLLIPDDLQADVLARIHASAFEPQARWSAQAIQDLGAPPHGAIISDLTAGLLILRFAAEEVEVLSVAVMPEARGNGVGARLMHAGFIVAKRFGAERMFLEVAIDNDPALALYRRLGFAEIARRKNYYRRAGELRIDATVMALDLK